MGWGIEYKGYISRVSKDSIKSEISLSKELRDQAHGQLLVLAATTPAPVADSEGRMMQPDEYLPGRVNELLEQYGDACTRIAMLLQASDDPSAAEDV